MRSLRRVVRKGAAFDVCAVVLPSGKCKVEDFLCELQRSNPRIHKRLIALLAYIAQYGHQDLGSQKFEIVRGGVVEIKDPAGIRLFGFIDPHRGQLLIVERGWKKGKKNEQRRQIEEVGRFKSMYNSLDWKLES